MKNLYKFSKKLHLVLLAVGFFAFSANVKAQLSLSISQTNVTCKGGADGSATLTASGGTSPYTYNWNASFNSVSVSGITVNNLSPAKYYTTVTDALGASEVDSVTITEPALIETTISQTACDTFTWSLTGMTYDSSGIYMDTLSAMNGCDSIVNLDLTINYTL
ncbi:MAG: SprB repeat-containing protein, partial [Vicingaceae bacterium]